MIRVVIVEDDRDFIYLIETMLGKEEDIDVIGSYVKKFPANFQQIFCGQIWLLWISICPTTEKEKNPACGWPGRYGVGRMPGS